MAIDEARLVKLLFRLEPDDDGYPPVSVEGVWSIVNADGSYTIHNFPFYIMEVSYGDIVSVSERDGELWYSATLKPSANTTLRIIFYEEATESDRVTLKIRLTDEFGCGWEGCSPALISVNVPPITDKVALYAQLDQGEHDEIWTWQMGAERFGLGILASQ